MRIDYQMACHRFSYQPNTIPSWMISTMIHTFKAPMDWLASEMCEFMYKSGDIVLSFASHDYDVPQQIVHIFKIKNVKNSKMCWRSWCVAAVKLMLTTFVDLNNTLLKFVRIGHIHRIRDGIIMNLRLRE